MKVHVFVFEHRYGLDVSVHATARGATAAAGSIARRWWKEAVELDSTLPPRPPSSDAEAVDLYFGAQEGLEHYEIRTCDVEGLGEILAGGAARDPR